MNNTLQTSRCARRAFSARTALAAAAFALACGGCAEIMQAAQDFDNAVAVALGGQPVHKSAGNAGGASGSSVAGKPIEGEINSTKALQFLYGKVVFLKAGEAESIFGGSIQADSECREFAPWKPSMDFLRDNFLQATDTSGKTVYLPDEEIGYYKETAAVCKSFDARYTENGVEKYIIITEAMWPSKVRWRGEDMSHCTWGERTIVGAAVFFREGGQWKLEAENKYVDGAFCRAGIGNKLLHVGMEKYGVSNIYAVASGGGGGWIVSIIIPNEGGINDFSVSPESESLSFDGHSGEETEDVALTFDEKSESEYYDAILRYKYTAREGAKRVTKTIRFRFVNGKYEEVKAAKKSSAKKRK